MTTVAVQNDTLFQIPKLSRVDYAGILDEISKFLSEEQLQTYTEMGRTYEQMCSDLILFKRCETEETQAAAEPEPMYDYSWWEQDEEDWDVYGDSSEMQDDEPLVEESGDPFDHLTEEELEEYFFDRRMKL
jgi:hypothetical protein